MIELSQEQRKAYDRFIKARDRVKLVHTSANKSFEYVRFSDVEGAVDVDGMGHPLYVRNDAWIEYKEAFEEWLRVEPEFRKEERMRATRGDYGTMDNWNERTPKARGMDVKFKGE